MTKTAIITGASSGLGFAIAKAYLARGYNVVGNARTMDRLPRPGICSRKLQHASAKSTSW